MAVFCFNKIQEVVLTEGTQVLEKPSSQGMSKGIIQVRLPFRFWADDHNCWKESNISLLLPHTNWSWFLFSAHYPFDQPSWEISENSPNISLVIIALFLRSHTHTHGEVTQIMFDFVVYENTHSWIIWTGCLSLDVGWDSQGAEHWHFYFEMSYCCQISINLPFSPQRWTGVFHSLHLSL